mmetsp:Transcript_39916/g.58662  ORF Transcript_39916/g.58662 Transcript_39916/m.58662 type:complete len:210 (-) Transcript_39916:276-905(-)
MSPFLILSLLLCVFSERAITAFVPATPFNSRSHSFSPRRQQQQKLKMALDPMSLNDLAEQVQTSALDSQSHVQLGSQLNNVISDGVSNMLSTTTTIASSVAQKMSDSDMQKAYEMQYELEEESSYYDVLSKIPIAATVLAVSDFAITRIYKDDYEDARKMEEMTEGDKRVEFVKLLGLRLGALFVVCFLTIVVSSITFHPDVDMPVPIR